MGNLVNTELDSLVAAFNSDDEAALMAASGQQTRAETNWFTATKY